MPVLLLTPIERKVLFHLTQELQKRLPGFKPNSEGELLSFVYKDLGYYINEDYAKLDKWIIKQHKEFQYFLGFWVGWWLKKWRERVKILHKKIKIHHRHRERIERANKIYKRMDHCQELKRAIINRLVEQGEICMPDKIADELIIKEILRKLPTNESKDLTINLNPIKMLSNIIPKIIRLTKIRRPLIYLNIKYGIKRFF